MHIYIHYIKIKPKLILYASQSSRSGELLLLHRECSTIKEDTVLDYTTLRLTVVRDKLIISKGVHQLKKNQSLQIT